MMVAEVLVEIGEVTEVIDRTCWESQHAIAPRYTENDARNFLASWLKKRLGTYRVHIPSKFMGHVVAPKCIEVVMPNGTTTSYVDIKDGVVTLTTDGWIGHQPV